jgi:putative FmdB family regulatory protein
MPIYAYRCEGCGFQKDALQKLSDPPLVDCPSCGQPRLAKQLTAAGFALKGTGWYVTDFRDQSKKPAASGKPEPAGTPVASEASSASSGDSAGSATPASANVSAATNVSAAPSTGSANPS